MGAVPLPTLVMQGFVRCVVDPATTMKRAILGPGRKQAEIGFPIDLI